MQRAIIDFIRAVMGEGTFSNAIKFLVLREERRDGQKIWDNVNDAKLKGLVADLDGTSHCMIVRSRNTGAWLNVRGTTVTGTVLLAMEFCEFYAHIMMLPTPNFRANVTAVAHP